MSTRAAAGAAGAGASTGGGGGVGGRLASFAASLRACGAQSKAYADCLSAALPGVEKGQCGAEFEALRRCFLSDLRSRRALPGNQ